ELDDMTSAADSQHRFKAGRRDVRFGERVEQFRMHRAIEQVERELRCVRPCKLDIHGKAPPDCAARHSCHGTSKYSAGPERAVAAKCARFANITTRKKCAQF